jgi:electron transport complex protein RnfC
MRDKAAEIVSGIRLMLVATGAGCAKVGIEDNKPEAIAAMREAARASTITIVPVPARYPMGSDRQLIVELTGREVPSDARAADVGVIVHNVALPAVHEAVVLGRPLVSASTVNGGRRGHARQLRSAARHAGERPDRLHRRDQGEVAKLVMGGR